MHERKYTDVVNKRKRKLKFSLDLGLSDGSYMQKVNRKKYIEEQDF